MAWGWDVPQGGIAIQHFYFMVDFFTAATVANANVTDYL